MEALRNNGYMVVNLDRIGSGLSDHPPAELLNLRVAAYTMHQLVDQIKNGTYRSVPNKIFYLGHSMESMIGAYLTSW